MLWFFAFPHHIHLRKRQHKIFIPTFPSLHTPPPDFTPISNDKSFHCMLLLRTVSHCSFNMFH